FEQSMSVLTTSLPHSNWTVRGAAKELLAPPRTSAGKRSMTCFRYRWLLLRLPCVTVITLKTIAIAYPPRRGPNELPNGQAQPLRLLRKHCHAKTRNAALIGLTSLTIVMA